MDQIQCTNENEFDSKFLKDAGNVEAWHWPIRKDIDFQILVISLHFTRLSKLRLRFTSNMSPFLSACARAQESLSIRG